MDLDERKGKMLFEEINEPPSTAVADVYHDLQRTQRGNVHIAEQVGDIVGIDVKRDYGTRFPRWGKVVGLHKVLDVVQTGIATDRP